MPVLGSASHLMIFHYVLEGELHIRMEGEDGEGLSLGAGELILLPRNDLHLMGSELSLPPVEPATSSFAQSRRAVLNPSWRQRQPHTDGLRIPRLRQRRGNPVISTLPPLVLLNVKHGGAAEWIRSTFQYAAEEVAAGRPGSETVLAKLSELLFVEAVRRYVETLPDGQTGWLAGLRDPYVARALALLHRDITRPWNVDDLGREVGLSRSALADRFIHLIGVPPMHYLASWRMQVAAQKLRNTSASLAQVAEIVATVPRPLSPTRSRRRSVLHRPPGDVRNN